MKYPHIVRYVAESLWAIMPNRIPGCRHAALEDILNILAFRAAGKEFTAEELHARIGDPSDPVATNRGAIAVLPLRGVIAHRMNAMDEMSGGMSTEQFAKMFRAALANEQVGTIVIDVDSPGGTVQGVPELAAELLAARGQKKIVAVANAMMASAAYWIAAAADEIVVTPSGLVGSIGVYTAHEDLSAALEKEGVKVTLISAGKYKVEGNPFEPISDEYKGVVQARVDDFYNQFVKAVAAGRGVTPAAVKSGYGEGRVLNAKDAKAAGLVDRIATMDETLARLAGAGRSRSGARAELVSADVVAALEAADAADAALLDAATEQVGAEIDQVMAADRDRRIRLL
jgi:signal peptide peptidase SppA